MNENSHFPPTHLPDLNWGQVAPNISNVTPHGGVQAQISALHKGLAVSWFEVERKNLCPESVGFKVAHWTFVEHDSFVLCQSH